MMEFSKLPKDKQDLIIKLQKEHDEAIKTRDYPTQISWYEKCNRIPRPWLQSLEELQEYCQNNPKEAGEATALLAKVIPEIIDTLKERKRSKEGKFNQ